MPDFASPATLTSPLPDNGWVVDRSSNVSTVVMIGGVAVAQGDWWSGKWSGNINLQMLAPKGSTVTGTTGQSLFVPIVKSKPYSQWCIKY